jgi:hypothetical protein
MGASQLYPSIITNPPTHQPTNPNMKTTPQNKPTRQPHSHLTASISTRLLIAMNVVAALLFLGSYFLFSKKAPPAANSEPKPTIAATPVEKPPAPPAPKRNPPPNTPNAKINKFKAFDLDGNGICPREEYMRAHLQHFDRCDKNKDGMLDRTEFPANAIGYHDKNKDAKLDRGEYQVRYDELFLIEDKNKDGVLFVEEM